jgi:hypothetical protein
MDMSSDQPYQVHNHSLWPPFSAAKSNIKHRAKYEYSLMHRSTVGNNVHDVKNTTKYAGYHESISKASCWEKGECKLKTPDYMIST